MSQMGQFDNVNGAVETITGNTGGAVSPTGANINLVGAGGLTVTGNPATSTLTISGGGGGGVAVSFGTDVGGPAVPTGGGLISFITGSNISTNGATANTVHINLVNSPSVSGSLTAGTTITSTNGDITVGNTNANPGQPNFFTHKSRGGGVITTGDSIGALQFQGYDGTQFTSGAGILSDSSGTIGNTRVAANLQFFTHADAPGVMTQRMVIAPTGTVTINAPDAGTALTIAGGGLTVTAGATTLTPLNTQGIVFNSAAGVLSTHASTLNAVQIGTAGGQLTDVAVGTTGQVLTGVTAGAPVFANLSGISVTSITGTVNQITASSPTGAVTLSIPAAFIAPGSITATTGMTVTAGGLTVTSGNTTLTPLNAQGVVYNSAAGVLSTHATTNHAVQVGNATGQFTDLAVGTNGQVLLGSTGANPAFATLTSTANTITYTTGPATLNLETAPFQIAYTSVNAAASPYTALGTDVYISVDSSGGAVTIRLPNAPTNYRYYTIKDRTGNAAANNITVTTVGGAVNIDGAVTFVMTGNFQSANVVFNGATYEIY